MTKTGGVSKGCEPHTSIPKWQLGGASENHNQLITGNSNSSVSNISKERYAGLLTASLQYKSPTSTISHKIVSPFISTTGEFPHMIFLEGDSEELDDSNFEYKKTTRIKKEMMKPIVVRCHTDFSGNIYLKEEDSKTDLRSFICNDGLEQEETEISDLFDYYFGEEDKERNTYNLESLDPLQRESLQRVLRQNVDQFIWEGEKLEKTNFVKHYINTGDALFIKNIQKQIIKDKLSQKLKEGLIQPCESSWTSPMVLVHEKDGQTHLLDSLNGSSWYSSLDLASGYWQVEPDFSKTLIVFTDASDLALGTILSQKDEKGNEQVVYYTSRSLSTTENNYSVTEKECLAVIWAVGYF
ncbi:1361_t:CDS:2 [Gigaspora rosea]|nr:1361_t:CDS:2 [Gigaspora rosea]